MVLVKMMDANLRHRKSVQKTFSSDYKENKNVVSSNGKQNHCFKCFLIIFLVFVVTCLFGYATSPIKAVAVGDLSKVDLSGSFEINYKLIYGKRISMPGPESVVEDEVGNLFTGLIDGRIIKIHRSSDGVIGEGRIENITDGYKPDDYATSDALPHHRPLGIRLRNETLYVIDAYYGFFTIDLSSKKIQTLVKLTDVFPPMFLPDDLDVTADGSLVYFSDASSKFTLAAVPHEVLKGECTGRLFKYNLETKELSVVVNNLCFANGVQLTKDEKTIMVAETSRARVSWIDTTTWQTKHVLKLPAMPDNIRKNAKGNYWIATAAKLSWSSHFLFQYPVLRQIIAGLVPIELLHRMVNHRHSILVEVDDNGNVLDTFHDPNGALTLAVSQATCLSDGRIALGSNYAPFLSISKALKRK